MKAAIAIAMTFAAVGMAAAQTVVTKPRADLMDQGFRVVAEGALVETIKCAEWESRMRVIGERYPNQPLYSNMCLGNATEGAFQRLKKDSDEFVCVSFRGWACYPSPAQN